MGEPWMVDANCRGLTDLMFPERGDTAANARAVCNDCAVWRECLDWAMTPACPPDGVVAGLTPRERQQLRHDTRVSTTLSAGGQSQSTTAGPMPWINGVHEPPPTTWTRTELLTARDM